MSIASRIENMETNISKAYKSVEGLGADLTGVDKNLENLSVKIDEIYDEMPKVEGTGTNITLENTRKAPMSLTLKGNIEQDSTTGKNLLPNNATSQTIRGITFTINDDKSITLNGTNDNTGSSTLFLITEVSNFSLNAGTYNSIATGVSGVNIGAYDGTNYYTLAGGSRNSITLQNNTSFASVYLQVSKGNPTTFNNKKIYPMLSLTQVGESDYEPYTNGPAPNPDYPQDIHIVSGDNTITISNSDNTETQTQLISLGDIKLCKIGDYQDYIYKSSGKWYLHKEIGKTTDTIGSTGITINDMVSNGQIYSYYGGSVSGKTITYDSAISGTNTIYYQLATSTDTEITDSTLISQLEKTLYSYSGQTNISQTNNDLPFILDVKALKLIE